MEKENWKSTWLRSFLAALIGGGVTLIGAFVSIGEYKARIDNLDSVAVELQHSLEVSREFRARQTAINERVLTSLEKLEARLDRHLERANGK